MSSRGAGNFRLQGAGKKSDRVRAYGHGRICGVPGCGTLLSTYNPSLYCALHNAGRVAGPRTKRTELPLEERPCADCGRLFATAKPSRRFCGDHCRLMAFMRRRGADVVTSPK